MIKSIAILSIILLVFYCKPERSCESCYEKPPPRTVPNELLARCSVFIPDESKVRKIYVEVRTKLWPGHYKIFDSLEMDGRHLYDSGYDLKNYLDMSDYQIGDSFFYRSEVRWKFQAATYEDIDTLIY